MPRRRQSPADLARLRSTQAAHIFPAFARERERGRGGGRGVEGALGGPRPSWPGAVLSAGGGRAANAMPAELPTDGARGGGSTPRLRFALLGWPWSGTGLCCGCAPERVREQPGVASSTRRRSPRRCGSDEIFGRRREASDGGAVEGGVGVDDVCRRAAWELFRHANPEVLAVLGVVMPAGQEPAARTHFPGMPQCLPAMAVK